MGAALFSTLEDRVRWDHVRSAGPPGFQGPTRPVAEIIRRFEPSAFATQTPQ
jgi:hypothetical protein